jgi:hypothetical protein
MPEARKSRSLAQSDRPWNASTTCFPWAGTKPLTLPGRGIYTARELNPRRVSMNMPTRIRLCLFLMTTLIVTSTRALGDEPHQSISSGPKRTWVFSATAAISPDPIPGMTHGTHRSRHRIGLAGIGLMAGALGAIWRVHRGNVQRRRRRRFTWDYPAPRGKARPARWRKVPRSNPAARQRIRRFDYDRFYLHLMRDL